MPDENETSPKGKSGVHASVRASVGALSSSGEPGQRERTWKLWKDRFVRATRWMAVNDTDKLDLLLLLGGEDLQKLLQTLPEQPTEYKSHIEMLDVIFQKRVRVFHRGFKHEKTDESTRPQAECFYCFQVFETLMKHEARVFEITSPTKEN